MANNGERGRIMKQNCLIMISTKVDGKKSEYTVEGEVEILLRSAYLSYCENQSVVKVFLCGEKAEINREGDYALSLCLETGKTTQGRIGIAGNSGENSTYTHKIESRIAENFIAARFRYDLIIAAEKQEMELNLFVKI